MSTVIVNIVRIKGERIVSLDDGKEQLISINGEFRALRRKDIIDTLFDALPPATVKFGCQLESINTDTDTAKSVLRFLDGSSIIAKVVIGCDGGNSVVANYLNLKPTKIFSLCGVRGFTNYPNGHSFDHEFGLFRKDNILVGRIPMDDNMVYWFCAHPYLPEDERTWESPELIRRSTLEVLSAHPQEIEEMIKNADINSFSLARLRYRTPWDLLTGTFYKGAVVVAGDALHVMGPFLGQGGSAGLEDSVVLARHITQKGLKQVGNERKIMVEGLGEAFNMYAKQRRMRVLRLSLETYLTGMLLGATSRLKKVMYFMVLSFLFPIKNGHVDYDCGSL
uniref:monooxygenase 1-like isoform X2 n=1 Tax=Erigeron canadensis TaxID=72917 RepID=UPI001CB9C902|nr:monooxygenase 1-like isoform X2 [Erigeron canadensis]